MTIWERVTIQPGGVVEVKNPGLPTGAEAEVWIQVPDLPGSGSPEETPGGQRRPIWEVVEEIGARIPPEEWQKVPSDLSQSLDHYLYGAPRPEE